MNYETNNHTIPNKETYGINTTASIVINKVTQH